MTVRMEIEHALHTDGEAEVDLEGIVTMSPSFADELFGKLGPEIASGHLRFESLSPHLREIAHMATSGRGG
ncbi:MAG: STAS-like domain-containing protein [Solirubrobacteraceae bacterium]